MHRKCPNPKKWTNRKIPGKGIALGGFNAKKMPLILSKTSHPKSKYFFDMLCSLYPGVVGQFILPYLPPLNTKDGMAWFTMIHEYGNQCGLYKQNLLETVFLPAFEHAPPAWRNVTINMSEYLKWTSCINDNMDALYNFVASVHTSCPTLGLCMDFVQCRECMIPCKWCQKHESEEGLNQGCITRLSNSIGFDCVQRANMFFKTGIKCRIPMHKLAVKGVDTGTPRGIKIINSVLNTLTCMGSPKELVLDDICTKRDNLGLLVTMISNAVAKDCESVSLDNWTVIGGIMEHGAYFGGYIPVAIIEAVSSPNLKNLSVNNAALPVKKSEMRRCVRAVLKMKNLEKLTLNCKNSTNGFDSSGIFLKTMAREMNENGGVFSNLKDVTISFGDSSFKRSSVSIAIAAVNGTQVEMDYYYEDMSDDGNDEFETLQVPENPDQTHEMACMLGFDRAPMLRTLSLQCSR